MSDDASPTPERPIDASTPLSAWFDATRRSLKQARETLETASEVPAAAETIATVEVGQTPAQVVYRENKLELLHYEARTDEQHAPPILVVYALINRPYILDLQPDRSVVRRLLEAGHDVYLIRWGEPSLLDASLGLGDYVDRYIDNCVDTVRERAGTDDVHLLGYCMGGTMSTMYAARYPEKVRTLGLMAAGLCFEGEGGVLERWGAEEHFDPARLAAVHGTIPAEFLSAGFDLMDPVQNTITKYLTLLENLDDPDFLENFARMERWLDEGVDVPGTVFREFVEEVYQANALIENDLTIDGRPVDIERIQMPVLQIVGTYDHLIPPAASKPFTDAVPSTDTEIVEFDTGHVGLSVSSRSHEELWPQVAQWFATRSDARDPAVDSVPAEPSPPDEDTGVGDDDAAAGDVAQADDESDDEVADESDSPSDNSTRGNAPDQGTATVEESVPGVSETLVDALDGVGPTYADRLREAGFHTVAAIAAADCEALIEAADAPASRVELWIEQARDRR